ncbi:hypothetical protein [Demequina phytophila]|uniref:hypothetical protein n=1 Tax=Demequina phytophila TaxID=1638981 RepID=UPI000AA2F64B|nr:hypothetical protein [Demequina phytophila]
MTAAIFAAVFAALLTVEMPEELGDLDARAGEREFEVNAALEEVDEGNGGVTSTSSGRTIEWLRTPACAGRTPQTADNENCSPLAAGELPECEAGMTPLLPTWWRELIDGVWTGWQVATWYTCPNEQDLFALIEREWTELRPEPSEMSLQPGTGVVYATVPTIAIADDSQRFHNAILLGAEVEIRATPANYTWTWGDGEETTTDDPGAPYPNATVTHAYGRSLDAATVTLTTTWSGEWRAGGGTWSPFDTTIATTSPGVALEVLHPRAVLVDGPLG